MASNARGRLAGRAELVVVVAAEWATVVVEAVVVAELATVVVEAVRCEGKAVGFHVAGGFAVCVSR